MESCRDLSPHEQPGSRCRRQAVHSIARGLSADGHLCAARLLLAIAIDIEQHGRDFDLVCLRLRLTASYGYVARGHDVSVSAESGGFGYGQAIWRTGSTGYVAGTEPRADGVALGF